MNTLSLVEEIGTIYPGSIFLNTIYRSLPELCLRADLKYIYLRHTVLNFLMFFV